MKLKAPSLFCMDVLATVFLSKYNYLFTHNRIVFLMGLLLAGISGYSQNQTPKREFRGVWIATVKNIDWPSRAGLSSEEQQRELVNLIDRYHQMGMNAIIFQVRPAGDVFYFSAIEPWSEWLTGIQGKAPVPFYDPLQVAIEACHERGMELHAWVNPFRAYLDVDRDRMTHVFHVMHTHPEWVVTYGPNAYIDPGIPAARDYVVEVIEDIVMRYDIDAIHIDDYFYPYKIEGKAFPDTLSFERYGRNYRDKDEWRRENNNQFIYELRNTIKTHKPWVELGISPFGVWRNNADDPLGSDTRAGVTSYDDLYADVRTWLQKGWIDYVAPQIYFSIGYPPADYAILLDWWSQNSFNRQLYIGKAAYKVNNNHDQNWKLPGQIPGQIRMDRQREKVDGSIYFSAKSLILNPLGVGDSLKNVLYRYRSLPPEVDWSSGEVYTIPQNLEASVQFKGVVLTWNATGSTYVGIYRFGKKDPINISDPRFLLDVTSGTDTNYIDDTIDKQGKYYYVITSIDRLFKESLPTLPLKVKVKRKMLQRR